MKETPSKPTSKLVNQSKFIVLPRYILIEERLKEPILPSIPPLLFLTTILSPMVTTSYA
ncbi:MAG: hypothetical protein RRY79_05655 [Clostridia bacterium]